MKLYIKFTFLVLLSILCIHGYAQTIATSGITKIEAENFTAQYDVQTETTTDFGGGLNVGYIDDNDWMSYQFTISKTGTYLVTYRIASLVGGGVLQFGTDDDSQIFHTSDVPITNGWQQWDTIQVMISLSAGTQTFKITALKGGFNLNWFSFAEIDNTPYLHTLGECIVDQNGYNFIFKSVGTGNWMIQEGYMMQSGGIANTQHEFRAKLIETIGEDRTNEFYDAWLQNGMTKTDVDSLAAWGFNAIRVALHYVWFTLPIEEEPVSGQNTWLDKGFELTDSLLSWCEQNEIYLILDMHGTPGGQGKNADISDYDPSKQSLWESEDNKNKLVALWTKLAQRYANEKWIGGYDMINETNWDFENTPNENGCMCSSNIPLVEMHKRIIDGIRSVDQNHIVFVSGNCWGNNYSGMDELASYDDNLAYTFHKYWNYNYQSTLQGLFDMRSNLGVPLWMSESGENSNTWFSDAIELFENNNVGWSWWPVKKDGINNVLKVQTNNSYKLLLEMWKGNGSMTADEAYNAVMQFAEQQRVENCQIGTDVIHALMEAPHTNETRAYKYQLAIEPVFAAYYDYGRNGYAYNDVSYANYHSEQDQEWTTWNTNWLFRNDGVDIISCNDEINATLKIMNGLCTQFILIQLAIMI